MLVTINHIKSVTVADGTNTDLQRPSDWNSSHAATIQFTNTDLVQWFSAGTSSISSGTLVFGNSNNVSFGFNTAAGSVGTMTASYRRGGCLSHPKCPRRVSLPHGSGSVCQKGQQVLIA